MNDPSRFGVGDEPSRAADLKNLRVVGVLHYVAGALLALFSSLFIGCIWFGVRSMRTHVPGASSSFGPLVVGMGSVALVLGWTMAGMMVQAGRCIEARRSRRLCLIVAALSTGWFPFGSILGLFTLVLLTKPHVRALFGEDAPPPAGTIRPDDDPAWAGWVSADAKGRFFRRAIFIGAGLLFVQLALPLVMLARTLGSMTWGTNVIVDEAESADTYAGRVWFVESVSGPGLAASKRLAMSQRTTTEFLSSGPTCRARAGFSPRTGRASGFSGSGRWPSTKRARCPHPRPQTRPTGPVDPSTTVAAPRSRLEWALRPDRDGAPGG
jgi:hypothetical protein